VGRALGATVVGLGVGGSVGVGLGVGATVVGLGVGGSVGMGVGAVVGFVDGSSVTGTAGQSSLRGGVSSTY
jgi:hypothetical protein